MGQILFWALGFLTALIVAYLVMLTYKLYKTYKKVMGSNK